MEKIAVSSQGQNLDDQVDPRFGRTNYFLVVESDSMECTVVDNSASCRMPQGAGIHAAELVAGSGAGVVLSGFVGPKAYQALSAVGIQIGQGVDGLSVREAVDRYKSGQLEMAKGPNKPGHWK